MRLKKGFTFEERKTRRGFTFEERKTRRGFTFEERKTRKGFTLIELLVVISIIGMLTALIVVNFNSARARARDVQRKSDLNQIKKALRMYYNDHNSYPADDGSGKILGCGVDGTTVCAWDSASGWTAGSDGMVYMRILSQDPLYDDQNYSYYAGALSCSEGTNDFRLVAVLENKSDADIGKSHTRCGDDCGFTWNTDNQNQYVVCAD